MMKKELWNFENICSYWEEEQFFRENNLIEIFPSQWRYFCNADISDYETTDKREFGSIFEFNPSNDPNFIIFGKGEYEGKRGLFINWGEKGGSWVPGEKISNFFSYYINGKCIGEIFETEKEAEEDFKKQFR
jgi:hypothetical protein